MRKTTAIGARLSLRTASVGMLAAALVLAAGCGQEPSPKLQAQRLAAPHLYLETVGDCPIHEPLEEPQEVVAVGDGAVLDTTFTVRMETHPEIPYVLTTTPNTNEPATCELRSMDLRTYRYPGDGGPTFPGPTLRVNMSYLADPTLEWDPGTNPVLRKGSRLRIDLRNELPNTTTSAGDCQVAKFCDNSSQTTCTSADDCDGGQCVEVPQESPNCFHGPEVTNLHYHGSHVSPQPHQDFVLLKLFSSNQVDPAPPPPNGFDIAVGSYQTDIPQLPWNQAPGSHWYHPHKHGSTALQVGNGMAGALLIEGPIDDWLAQFYDLATAEQADEFEKVLVVQQIFEEIPFWSSPLAQGLPPYPLVNGQLVPMVKMEYGEVQRWRLIGATMNQSAQASITFPSEFEVKQIAQDGVQFVPENYAGQPFGTGPWALAPGNRIDFLVKAPPPPDDPQQTRRYHVQHRVLGQLGQQGKRALQSRKEAIRGMLLGKQAVEAESQEFNEPLFAIEVQGDDEMELPADDEWPEAPYYLRDIDSVVASKTVRYSMTTPDGVVTQPGVQANSVWLDGRQYHSDCAAFSDPYMTLGTAEEWIVTNDSSPNHPHHIHVNPFQIREKDGTVFAAPYPWMDTIALPTGAAGSPKQVVLRQRYDDYSGAFVIHCHFLAHEDRGMMANVQTVCENEQFGTPQPDGLPDDCATPSTEFPVNPLPDCNGVLAAAQHH